MTSNDGICQVVRIPDEQDTLTSESESGRSCPSGQDSARTGSRQPDSLRLRRRQPDSPEIWLWPSGHGVSWLEPGRAGKRAPVTVLLIHASATVQKTRTQPERASSSISQAGSGSDALWQGQTPGQPASGRLTAPAAPEPGQMIDDVVMPGPGRVQREPRASS